MMRLIDADALNLEYEVDMADDWKTAHEIANIVKYAPTIDAEPVRRGKWKNDCMGVLHCSECNTQAPWKYGGGFIDYRWESNFCPNCGARMDAE